MMNTILTAASIAFIDPVKPAQKRSARRNLFGARSDADDDFVKRLIHEMSEEYKRKWEFDFINDAPLPTTSDSKFTYTQIDPSEVPGFYRVSSYPSCHSSPVSDSDSENKSPDTLDSSLRTEESFLMPTSDESGAFYDQSVEDILKASTKKPTATPKKRQTHINGRCF